MQVTAFIKVCKEQIDILKNSISDDEENSKGWLGIRTDNSNADTIAHKHGVVCFFILFILFIFLWSHSCVVTGAITHLSFRLFRLSL